MSLLDSAMEPFVMIDKTTAPDGYGGSRPAWKEGAEFQAAATYDNSMQAKIGAVQGVTSLYTITTRRAVNLKYHEICKRVSDGAVFRITTKGNDRKTPPAAGLDMRVVEAEEWKLTDEGVKDNG